MTIDQDRGAYAPHMDAPLAFDARRPTDRRPLPMTLIASAGVLVLIVGALAMAYRGGVRGGDQPRIVGEPVGAIKTAAAPEAASDATDQDSKMDVYAAQNVPARAAAASPAFAPAPEQPKGRPVVLAQAPTGLQVNTVDPVKVRIGEPEVTAAPVLTAADRQAAATSRTAIVPGAADRAPPPVAVRPPPAEAAPHLAAIKPPTTPVTTTKTVATKSAAAATPAKGAATRTVASADTAPAAARPAKSMKIAIAEDAATKTTAAKTSASAKPVKVARVDADDAAPAKPATKAATGAAAVQVGAFSSAELAQKGFADAGKLSALGAHAKSVEKISRDGKTFYRATLGGFADKAAAKAFCAKLTAAGGRCLVKS